MKKTFRLFVSSTFSDFVEERRLLQTEVFPYIKDHCTSNGLVFQPIDLRWGVTDDASNDQKTLELCLEEVQSSKSHPYPNFLIMLGDRYGTIILPYMIEQSKFEKVLCYVENHKRIKKLLTTWYKLDENQIPASYIIEQRKDAENSYNGIDYTNRKNWKPINQRLIKIFQTIVPSLNIEEKEKRKYFISATEAEVVEGVFKFLDKTPTQIEKLKENPNIEDIDYENVYAYIRNIKSIDSCKDKFFDDKKEEVDEFKKNIENSVKNIYEETVSLVNVSEDKNRKLSYYYEELTDTEKNFVTEMKKYLKSSVDEFLKEQQHDLTAHELELQEQERFKNDKLKSFLDGTRKEALKKIDDYINSNDEDNQALVVYGKSGLGKSSVMAKAIDASTKNYKDSKKIIYKFAGATANLNTTADLLISILHDLGIKEEIRKVQNPQTFQEGPEKIEEFYYRIHDYFKSLEQNTIIFLDAIDQVINEDEFLWLPQNLPSNVKIIISALDDENYEDTIYF